MYYTKQKGFGPFKRWALMEQVTPRHKPQEVSLTRGMLWLEDASRPISSATVKIDENGYIIFEGTGKTSVKAKTFDTYENGIVFQTEKGTQGYVARNGNFINPVQKGHAYINGSTITGVDVYGKVVVYQKVANDSNEIFYTVGDALSGLEVFPGRYASYKFGDRSLGIPGKVLILDNNDGTKTVANTRFAVFSDKVTKYDTRDQMLYLLSDTPNDRNGHKTVLEAYPISDASSNIPTLKFMEFDVVDFDASFRELITYKPDSSSVYTSTPGGSIKPKFTKPGVVKNIAPMFSDHDVYIQTEGKKQTVLLEDGQECTNQELVGIKDIKEGYGFAYIAQVETKNGVKEGMFRHTDMSTLLPPVYDQIRFFGENLFVGTYGETFLVGKVEEYKKDAYLPPETLLGVNNYFKPQLTNRDGVLYAEDSVGLPMVIDFNGRDNKPIIENVVSQASKELGIPLPEKEIEFVE